MKQADTVMLGYPLGLPMTPEVRRNDLEAYEPITDPQGPAMTWVRQHIVSTNRTWRAEYFLRCTRCKKFEKH